jgi:hypothetical protein
VVLLRQVADFRPGPVEDARHELGASLTEVREANKRWQAVVRSRTPAQAVRSAARTRFPPDARVSIKRETVGSEATDPNTTGSA